VCTGRFGVVGTILGTFELPGLNRLTRVEEFLYAFPRAILDVRKLLRVARPAAALRTYLAGIFSEFIGLGFIVIVAPKGFLDELDGERLRGEGIGCTSVSAMRTLPSRTMASSRRGIKPAKDLLCTSESLGSRARSLGGWIAE